MFSVLKGARAAAAPLHTGTELSNVTTAIVSTTVLPAISGKKRKGQQREPVPSAAPTKRQKQSKPAVPTILAAPANHGKAVNSNWAALKGVVASTAHRRQPAKNSPASDRPTVLKAPHQLGTRAGLTPNVAIDCEMVGVGPNGTRSALAR